MKDERSIVKLSSSFIPHPFILEFHPSESRQTIEQAPAINISHLTVCLHASSLLILPRLQPGVQRGFQLRNRFNGFQSPRINTTPLKQVFIHASLKRPATFPPFNVASRNKCPCRRRRDFPSNRSPCPLHGSRVILRNTLGN